MKVKLREMQLGKKVNWKECCRCKEKSSLGVTDRRHEIAGRDLIASCIDVFRYANMWFEIVIFASENHSF